VGRLYLFWIAFCIAYSESTSFEVGSVVPQNSKDLRGGEFPPPNCLDFGGTGLISLVSLVSAWEAEGYMGSQTPQNTATADTEECDSAPMVARVQEIIRDGADMDSIMEAIRAQFGCLDPAAMLYQAVRATAEGDLDEEDRQAEEYIAHESIARLAAVMVDLERWRAVAAEDPDKHRGGLETLLRGIRIVINRYCGVEAHRPVRNQERDDLIVKLKRESDRSFGQVALAYSRAAGKTITAKEVERICKRRIDKEAEALIRLLRPDIDLEPILEAFNVELCRCPRHEDVADKPNSDNTLP
jgi:hypothetical protein